MWLFTLLYLRFKGARKRSGQNFVNNCFVHFSLLYEDKFNDRKKNIKTTMVMVSCDDDEGFNE